jgi:hypothetical protein
MAAGVQVELICTIFRLAATTVYPKIVVPTHQNE